MQNKEHLMVLAEVREGIIHPLTYELLAWGRSLADQLGSSLDCLVLGAGGDVEELIHRGADRVLAVESVKTRRLYNSMAGLLVRAIREEKPVVVIAPATTCGRTLMPVAAARLSTGLTADCTGLAIDQQSKLLLQTRPAIGGNVMATIKTPVTRPQMATVRPRSILPLPPDKNRQGEVIVKRYQPDQASWQEKFISFIRHETTGVNLEAAEIVVTGGKGMKNKENFRLVGELAEALGGGLGATRDAVEAGWAPFSCQVGLTGKTVAPKVYIGAGVAGKIQHLAGMITSEYIIAINEDPEAQIFKVADLGIVGDAPAMVEKLIQAVGAYKKEHGEGA